ncbi:hypothetical protein [Clostridium thailandense]|uniref:hypothetical protein n=1 Tax=Clostridium thailandense TaxID=2794346 RepID=UPI0039891761
MSYAIIIFLGLKISNIAKGKSKQIKFPNLWIMPVLFIFMIIEDSGKGYSISRKGKEFLCLSSIFLKLPE